jgi:hypothetical protein
MKHNRNAEQVCKIAGAHISAEAKLSLERARP